MKQHLCLTCGGALTNENGAWSCKYCGNVYEDESVQRDADMMRALLDEVKTEQVANLRRNLYDAINAKYIDSEEICRICTEIKKLLPDDFMAGFYYTANHDSEDEIAKYASKINADENMPYLEGIIDFMLRSYCSAYSLPLANLIERAFRKTNLEKFEHYITRLSEESEAADGGIYETNTPRDVFVAYSSKDMDKVYSLVSFLEANGLKCFVAARNLRHGRGAVQNYKNAIKEAISNSRSVVFVSSSSSRNFACDAIKFELPFIKQNDINNAPFEYKRDYLRMPAEYKLPRVEYRIDDGDFQNDLVREFFDGCEYAYTPEEVVNRIITLLSSTAEKVQKKPEQEKVKYCTACETKNSADAVFCQKCGSEDFAETAAEAKLKHQLEDIKKNNELRKLREEKKALAKSEREARLEEKKALAKSEKEVRIRAKKERSRSASMKKKIISAVAVSVVLVIVFLIVRSTVLVPTNKYNAALACIDAGDYISAYNILKDLKSFKDSEEKAASIFEDYKKALMKNIKPGSTIYLGRYEQDRDISSGKEDIEWIVLEVKDNRALIISKCALDRKPYNVTNDVVTWETCTLRTWLNTEFLSEAFSEEEQAKIALSTVTADLSAANPTHNQGNDTQDKVFLLSSTEAYKYLVTDDGCKNTKYASIEEKAKEKECAWITRTIRYGKTCSQSIIVGKLSSSYASPDRSSYSDVSSHKYIRPAMWITLDS